MINAKKFMSALKALEEEKGISKESIITALKEAMEKGFIKQLGVTEDMEDARVRVDIDSKKGTIAMYNIKRVVEEVEDDFVEISLEDANENGGHYEIGDDYEIEVPTDELTKLTAQQIKSVLKQKIAECEKSAIYEAYIDKKGEMINGIVEKVDDRHTIVNIGRTSVNLHSSQKIRNETFKVGETIKVYLADVSTTTKGPQILISRADPGFLQRLFEIEITEIYDGTVVIKDIAREAGDRSKVAVFSTDPNVDPVGTCIGPNGKRIQQICSYLGNAKEKEKIDIIAYNENPALYIAEALKPATVIGVSLDEAAKKAVAVVKNNELSLAIGKKGVNARLAVKLTGWNIDIKEIDDALGEGIVYKTIDQIKDEIDAASYVEPVVEEEVVEEETSTEEVVAPVTEEQEEVVETAEEVNESVEETVESVKEAEPVKEEVKEEPKVVKVTSNKKLEDLEKELEEEKKRRDRQQAYASRKRNYKKNEEAEEEEKDDSAVKADKSTYMSIYSEEELEEIRREEEEAEQNKYSDYEDEDEDDYSEYNQYYDDLD